MAIGSLPPVINEIQANSGQPGKTLAQQTAASSLLDLQAAVTTEPITAILPETTLIEKAVAEALGHQGGLAPLYATLTELADAPDLPDAVKTAIDTILGLRIGDGDVTPARVAEAIRSSGVFHEAVAAGKMAAALPPAVRQALGGAAGDGPQATTRPVNQASVPATSVAVARQVSAPTIVAPSIVPTPVSAAAQAYGRQGGGSPMATAPVSPQGAIGGGVGPSPTLTVPDAPVATAPASNSTAPSASIATPPAVNAAPVPVPAAPAGEVMSTVVAAMTSATAPLPPAVGSAPEGAIPTLAPAILAGGGEAQQVPSTSSGAVPASPGTPAMPAAVGQPADPLMPVSSNMAQSLASSPLPTPDPSEAQVSTQSSLTAPSASPPNATAASRSFAPWTPGRPFTPASPTASLPTPAGVSENAGPPAPPASVVSVGSETVAPRITGDRAPFVPSAVESLPNAPPEPVALRAAAGPSALSQVRDAPVQSVMAQSAIAQSPTAPAFSSQAALGEAAAGQTVSQSEPQAASQPRPLGTAGLEVSAPLARQSALQASQLAATLPLAAGVDLKGALEGLRGALITWLGRNADVMASLDGAGDTASSRVDRPQPPRKNGPVRGQPAVPLLDGDESEAVSTETLAGRALGEAERSLSRVFLHQAATAESRDMKAAQPTQALMLEIPIVGPSGTSVAQLRIEREDHAPNEPGVPPRRVFQVDIAFDVVPLGPVAVRVGLMDGRRVAVGVWCESDDGLVRMEAERENIVLGLEQEGMVVAGVDLHRGHPPDGHDETAVMPSHRLDLQL